MPKIDEHRAATAADILAPGSAFPRIDPRWEKNFERLSRLRERIVEQRSNQIANAHTGEPAFAINPADCAIVVFVLVVVLCLNSSEQNALYEIDQALRRIRDGAYGVCEATGKPIAADRLAAIPWTRFAREVEEQIEKEQQSRKPRHAL